MNSDWDKLVGYVAGEGSPEARARIEEWVREDPARERALRQLELLWAARGDRVDVDAGWQRLSARLAATPDPESAPARPAPARARPRRVRRPRRRRLRTGLLAAAAIASLLVLRVAMNVGGGAPDEWEDARAFTTERGELVRLELTDGTRVVLGVRSTLLVSGEYGATSREVRLDGEAFFDVASDGARPFVVHAEGARATVLGTRFGVSSRPDSDVDVVVTEGRVLVTPGAGEGSEVSAGEMGRVGRGGGLAVTRVDTTQHLGWLEGRLDFREIPFAEVLDHLELWYDVDFRVGDERLAARPLNVSLERPQLAELLQALMLAADATYRVEGRTVTFVPNP